MERRLQLLLDQERYDRVEQEAKRSGRSVAAVIREAIDVRFDDDTARRSAAAAEFLRLTQHTSGREPDWAETKAELLDDLDRKLG
jgi:predicted DNA-binding protein